MLPSTTDFGGRQRVGAEGSVALGCRAPAKPYEPLNRVRPYIETLRMRAASRVKEDKYFASLEGDVTRIHRELASKSISLNEAERRGKMAEEESRHAERQQETIALAASAPRTYEITLENVDSPGLPAPTIGARREAMRSPDATREGSGRRCGRGRRNRLARERAHSRRLRRPAQPTVGHRGSSPRDPLIGPSLIGLLRAGARLIPLGEGNRS